MSYPQPLIRRRRVNPPDVIWERPPTEDADPAVIARVLQAMKLAPEQPSNVVPIRPNVAPIAGAPDMSRVPSEIVPAAIAPLLNRAPVNDAPQLAVEPIQRQIAPYVADPNQPDVVGGGYVPSEMIAPPIASRLLRETPMTPERQLQGDMEGLAALRAAPQDFGHDSQGNPRIKPKGGFWGTLGAMAKTAGYRALDAITHGGSPILAAGAGLVEGGVNRGAPAAIRRQHEIQAEEGRVGKDLAIVKAQGGIQDDALDRTYRKAQIDALNRKATQGPKPIYRNNAQGQVVKIIPSQVEGEPDRTEIVLNDKKTAAPSVREVDGKLLIFNRQTGHYDEALDTQGKPITSELNRPVDFVAGDGKTYRVKPSTAAIASSTGQRFEISQAATESRFRRSEDSANRRAAESDARADRRQQDADRRAAEGHIRKAQSLRTEAAKQRGQFNHDAADALEAQADIEEQTAQEQFPDLIETVLGASAAPISAGGATWGSGTAAPSRLKIKPSSGRSSTRAQGKGSAWKRYVDTYFGGDEAKARAYQNQ